MSNMYEVFMPIKDYEDTYAVSNLGRVKNIKTGRILKQRKDKLSIPVYCITNNTVYNSSCEAARKLNLDNSRITACCKGKQKSTGKGYQFKYYTEGDLL